MIPSDLLFRKLTGVVAEECQSSKTAIKEEVLGRVFVEAHLKLYESVEEEISEAVSEVIQTHLREAGANLERLDGNEGDLESVAKRICPIEEWTEDLINEALPLLAEAMADSALSRWSLLGGEIESGKCWGYKTTAMEWLQAVGIETPPWLLFSIPKWMQTAIEVFLREAFSQPYWYEIAGTTKNDVERILRVGLQHGETLQTMARKLEASFPYDYSYKRGLLIARTETGNVLGAGSDIAFRKLKEDVGPEAGRYIAKKWVALLDDRTRDEHANLHNVIANEEGNWLLEGKWVPWPAHYSLSPKMKANCRCTFVVEFGVQPEDMTGLPYTEEE